MTNSGDHSQIASGGYTESALFERSAELSASRKYASRHELTSLALVTLMPPPAKTLISPHAPPRVTAAFTGGVLSSGLYFLD